MLATAVTTMVVLVVSTVVFTWRNNPHGWGKHEATIDTLLTLLHERPCSPTNVRWLVSELRAADDLRSAANYFDEIVDVCKLPSDVHKLAFDVHMATGENYAAVRDASRRILIDGSDRSAYLDRARAWRQVGRQDNAILDDEHAVRLGSSDPALRASIARSYRLLGYPEHARCVDACGVECLGLEAQSASACKTAECRYLPFVL